MKYFSTPVVLAPDLDSIMKKFDKLVTIAVQIRIKVIVAGSSDFNMTLSIVLGLPVSDFVTRTLPHILLHLNHAVPAEPYRAHILIALTPINYGLVAHRALHQGAVVGQDAVLVNLSHFKVFFGTINL